MTIYVGQQFGNYRLLTLLGGGGFAEVYLGKHCINLRKDIIKDGCSPLEGKSRCCVL